MIYANGSEVTSNETFHKIVHKFKMTEASLVVYLNTILLMANDR